MGAGVPTPTFLRRTHGLTAAAIVVACCVAAPADARAPAVDAAAVSGQVPAAVPVVEAGYALESTATEVAGTVERAVAGAADGVAGTGAPPTVDSAISAVGVVAPPPAPPVTAAGPPQDARHATGADATGSSRATGAQARRALPRRHADAPPRQARPVGPPAEPATVAEVGSASRGMVAGSAHPQTERALSMDPVSGAVDGSPASGASTGLFFGGLAVLMTALFLAAPGLGRRLPGCRAICPSAAFVPLLERPG